MIDFSDFFDGPEDPALVLQRPVCPKCYLEVPVTGECCGHIWNTDILDGRP